MRLKRFAESQRQVQPGAPSNQRDGCISLRNPFAGHPLRLGDLIGRHLSGQFIAVLGRRVTGCSIFRARRRQVEPHVGLRVVLRHAQTHTSGRTISMGVDQRRPLATFNSPSPPVQGKKDSLFASAGARSRGVAHRSSALSSPCSPAVGQRSVIDALSGVGDGEVACSEAVQGSRFKPSN